MTYRGHIIDGQVILDEPVTAANGTTVRVEVDEEQSATQQNVSIWDDLQELAGKAQGLPPDFAEEHDHYIHGTPKRNGK